MSWVVASRYEVLHRIGGGSFGDIYYAKDLKAGNTEQHVAVKVEDRRRTSEHQLSFEYRLYKTLNEDGYTVGIPNIHWFGSQGNYIMVMDLLGPSLEDLFIFMDKKFSLKTTLMLADQLITRLEFLHMKRYLHRDVKPDNFLMGVGKKGHHVYMVDFGLSKKYMDGMRPARHIPFKGGKKMLGTARYASVATLKGSEQGRRDDLESVGYMLMYFLRGSLPWQGLQAGNNDAKYKKIKDAKVKTSLEELCKGFPPEFEKYLEMTRALKFEQEPDYEGMRQLFRGAFAREGYTRDNIFDWDTKVTPQDTSTAT